MAIQLQIGVHLVISFDKKLDLTNKHADGHQTGGIQ
jgi:hypothetical protein